MEEKRRQKIIYSKRGSYLLEAVLTVPAFIIAMILLLSVIPMLATQEDAVFAGCDELIKADARAALAAEPVSAPAMTIARIRREHPGLTGIHIRDYRYRHAGETTSDLISLTLELDQDRLNPLSRISRLRTEVRLRSRTFTGETRALDGDADQFTRQEEACRVYVFPRRGERYHNAGCAFLHPACQMVYLTPALKERFSPCPQCHSSGAPPGTPVFCFFHEGKVYHYGSCSQVTKYYVEMDRETAREQGYLPCASCGG